MQTNHQVAALTTRLILGFIFFLQGFGKVFKIGVHNLYNMPFFKEAYTGLLPDFVTLATAYYTSFTELIAGLLLILGLKRDWALYALASVLVIVTFGHGLVEPIWDLHHLMFRAIPLVALLIMPKQWDRWSIDYYLNQKLKQTR